MKAGRMNPLAEEIPATSGASEETKVIVRNLETNAKNPCINTSAGVNEYSSFVHVRPFPLTHPLTDLQIKEGGYRRVRAHDLGGVQNLGQIFTGRKVGVLIKTK